jgi:hypothetical protein
MAAAQIAPELFVRLDYWTWIREVESFLQSMHMEPGAWQENWDYDFRKEYDSGATAHDAALHAHDFWWQQVLAESWT